MDAYDRNNWIDHSQKQLEIIHTYKQKSERYIRKMIVFVTVF